MPLQKFAMPLQKFAMPLDIALLTNLIKSKFFLIGETKMQNENHYQNTIITKQIKQQDINYLLQSFII